MNKSSADAALHIEDVYKSYGPKLVLENVDLTTSPGTFCSVVGPSGCGKSTLFRLVLGEEMPTKGLVHIEGERVTGPGTDRGIVYQRYSLYPNLTVLANVALGRNLRTPLADRIRKRKAIRDEAMVYLERVHLGQHAAKYPHELSGGMQQRVAIAQALIMQPRLLMMDEPFGALDPETRESMQLFILELWEEHRMTIFFVTHDMEEAVYLGNRVLVLSQHYTDDRGQGPGVQRGSRIVADYELPSAVQSTKVKSSPAFLELMQEIRRVGFSPDELRHVSEFNLRHPDSFQTLTEHEEAVNDQRDLEVMIASRYPIIAIESQEESRVLKLLSGIAAAKTMNCQVWTVAEGLRGPLTGQPAKPADATQALKQIDSGPPGLYVLLDFHPYLESPVNVRLIRKIAQEYDLVPRTLVFVSPSLKVPPEVEKLTAHFRLSLPDPEAIKVILKEEVQAWEGNNPGSKVQGEREAFDTLLRHLAGLCAEDVRRLVRSALGADGAITMEHVGRIVSRKHEMLAKDSVLSFELDTARFSDVAGLVNLKTWLEQRKAAFLGDAAALGLDVPKGIMLLGVQGCGKSLAAKATAGAWAVPLMRLDFGALYNKFLGETERNLRQALGVADAMAPCVLWMDEIEKGVASNDNDGGESRRLLGTLLTWMAERKTKVFLVATSNDIEALPPELVRKGRLDEIFFVDLPDAKAREEIFKIHLKRRKQDATTFDIPALVAKSEGFSGAEIEQAVVGALYAAHAAGQKLATENVLAEIARTRPLSVVMAEKIAYLRMWAADRTVKAD